MALRLLDTKTRFFDQDTFGLDKDTAKWGWLKYFLDLTLVTGTDPLDVNSIFIREEDNYWLFDLSLPEATSFKANLSVIELSNSSIPQLNKIHRVQEVKEGILTLALLKEDISVKPSDIPDSLGVKIKLVPLGYKKTFEEGLKVVYESANPENKRCYLRVDNGCPVGYLPYYTKFARVSMYSDIRYIDDYNYRIGRVKAPAESSNYNSTEESINYIWLHSRMYSQYNKINDYPPSIVNNFFIVGDDKTFYIFFRDLYNNYYKSDFYIFGEYEKVIYKEDPLPFFLSTSYFPIEKIRNEYDTFFSNNSGQHFFAQSENLNFTPKASDKGVYWYAPPGNSGSVLTFYPYMNECSFYLVRHMISINRDTLVVQEGLLRGLYRVSAKISLDSSYRPPQFQIYPDLDFIMFVGDISSSTYFYSFCLDLKDWK